MIPFRKCSVEIRYSIKNYFTFRCFPLNAVADVGVIVTDGVIERLLLVLD